MQDTIEVHSKGLVPALEVSSFLVIHRLHLNSRVEHQEVHLSKLAEHKVRELKHLRRLTDIDYARVYGLRRCTGSDEGGGRLCEGGGGDVDEEDLELVRCQQEVGRRVPDAAETSTGNDCYVACAERWVSHEGCGRREKASGGEVEGDSSDVDRPTRLQYFSRSRWSRYQVSRKRTIATTFVTTDIDPLLLLSNPQSLETQFPPPDVAFNTSDQRNSTLPHRTLSQLPSQTPRWTA
jgi:hypothetical protein